jgi:hypothetical protein
LRLITLIFASFLLALPLKAQILDSDNSTNFLQNTEPSKLQLMINYDEVLAQPDFFTCDDLKKYSSIGQIKNLKGLWSGTYKLGPKSIYWTNPKLDKEKILSNIKFASYKIFLNFNVSDSETLSKLLSIDIVQRDIKYGSTGLQIQNEKQINYWTTAKIDNWVQIIRGKVFRVNKNELLTIFQTTVYERKTPIYAFEGVAIINKLER